MNVRNEAETARHSEYCVSIAERIATEQGVSVCQLDPPLYDTIESDALETLLASEESTVSTPVTVQFEYDDYRVLVGSDGTLGVDRRPSRQ